MKSLCLKSSSLKWHKICFSRSYFLQLLVQVKGQGICWIQKQLSACSHFLLWRILLAKKKPGKLVYSVELLLLRSAPHLTWDIALYFMLLCVPLWTCLTFENAIITRIHRAGLCLISSLFFSLSGGLCFSFFFSTIFRVVSSDCFQYYCLLNASNFTPCFHFSPIFFSVIFS